MHPGIHNYSEIGKLNKVLLHRIGEEVEGLVPDNFERLLFDDIPFLKVARQEHDRFAEVLRENGVEVIYYVDETAKALSDDGVRAEFLDKFLDESNIISEGAREAIYDYLIKMPPKEMVSKLIAGVKRTDIEYHEAKSLADFISSAYPFYMDPMPNLYFTRDPGACVGNGLNVHHMSTRTRRREALLLKYMFMHNRDFAPEGSQLWYDYDHEASIEGGDVLHPRQQQVEHLLDDGVKQVFLRAVVVVQRRAADARPLGDVGHLRPVQTLFDENLFGGTDYLMFSFLIFKHSVQLTVLFDTSVKGRKRNRHAARGGKMF